MSMTYYGPGTGTKEMFYQQLVDSPPSVIAIDTETISLKERLPIGFAIATSPYEAWWFSSYPESDLEIQALVGILTNPNIKKVYANVMFDIRVQPLIFQDSFQADESNISDILVMARILGHTHASVSDLAPEIGRHTDDAKVMLDEYGAKTMLELPPELVASKCANDAMVTLDLYFHLAPQIEQLDGLSPDYMQVESEVIPILVDMSQRGLAIDQHARERMELRMEEDRDFYKKMCAEHDFNPGSGMQTGYILAKRGNFLPMTKSKRQLKTDEETLETIDDPLAAAVLGYKRANSILTKYLYPLRGLERIYTEYGVDTEVGRTKSSNFNMQNIPAASSRIGIDVRQIFLPDSGLFSTGDFSQLHLRFLAHQAGDREMKRVYEDGKDGGDIHISTMLKIHRPRSIAKIINYAIPYGGDPHTLAKQLHTKDLRWCSKLIDEWFDAYPDAAEYIREARRYALRHNKSLPTLFGRQIAIPEEINRWNRIDTAAMERKGANYPILGSDGEVIKRALIICSHHKLPLAVQVHDSITADGDCTFPSEALESLAPCPTPFAIDKSERWK